MAKTNYEIVKAWRKRNPERVAAQARRWRAKHPETRKVIVQRYRDKGGRALETTRVRERLRSNPGLRAIKWLQHKSRQEAKAGRPRPDSCDICGQDHGKICFDHCHESGHFRGWICDRCNKVLGLVYDNPGLLRELAEYLERSDAPSSKRKKERSRGLSDSG